MNQRPGRSTHYGNYSSNSGGLGMGAYAMERENDDQVDDLSKKLGILKEVSLQIGDEVNYQNRMLREMEDDFHKTGGILGTTMKRLQIMARTQTGRWMWWLCLFVVIVILYVYYRFKAK